MCLGCECDAICEEVSPAVTVNEHGVVICDVFGCDRAAKTAALCVVHLQETA